jgi:uncharacterized protein DUF3465
VCRLAALVSALWLAGCGAPAQADDAAIAADYHNHRSYVEVTADGTVVRLLPDRTSSTGTHEQFIIKLSSQNLTVEIEHNISVGARAPIAEGDHVIVHGEYVWNSKGGLIHFTHHDPQGTHEGGYIEDNGKTYD